MTREEAERLLKQASMDLAHLQAQVDRQPRGATHDQQEELDFLYQDCQYYESIVNRNGGLRRVSPSDPSNSITPFFNGGASNRSEAPQGFANMGEFFQVVRSSSNKSGGIDPRLVMNAPTTYSSEGIGADGGFAVPPQWGNDIWKTVSGEGSLVSFCRQRPTPSNMFVQPVDYLPPWSTSGIQAYWKAEGAQLTQSKIALNTLTERLHKLTALIPVTDELLEDAPGLDSYLRDKVSEIFDYQLSRAILAGTGAAEPLGILNSNALVSVDKETDQTADTLTSSNIFSMWARLHKGGAKNAIWIMDQTLLPELYKLSVEVGVGGIPVFMPANGGISAAPYDRLLGRPIIFSAASEPLGDQGDIILADLSQYLVVAKSGGIRTDVSMHLFFDYDMAAFRFVLRIYGAPIWSTAVSPREGNATLSPFVALDERA